MMFNTFKNVSLIKMGTIKHQKVTKGSTLFLYIYYKMRRFMGV